MVKVRFHDEVHFLQSVPRVPMNVFWDMTMAEVSTLCIPIYRVPVVSPRIVPPGGCNLRQAIRPDSRNAVDRLQPPTEARDLPQSVYILLKMSKSDNFNLKGRVFVGLHPTRSITKGPSRQ